jgi:hypothetical protein
MRHHKGQIGAGDEGEHDHFSLTTRREGQQRLDLRGAGVEVHQFGEGHGQDGEDDAVSERRRHDPL